jgi:hypothetical protein
LKKSSFFYYLQINHEPFNHDRNNQHRITQKYRQVS